MQRKGTSPGQQESVQSLRRRVGQLEEALRQSQQRFQAIFEHGPVGILLVGPGRKIIRASKAFCDMLGYAPDELVGVHVWDLTHPEDRGLDVPWAEKVMRGDLPSFQIQKRYLTKDGRVVWCTLTSTVVSEPSSGGYALSVVENITERKRAEEALKESEERYRTLVESSEQPILVVDWDGRFLFANRASAAALGGKPADFEGKTLWQLAPKEADAAMETLRRVMRSGQSVVEEGQFDILGQPRWYRGSVCPLKAGPSGRAVMVIAADITDHKKAEQDLRESEQRFRKVFEESPLGITLVDRDFRFIRVNPAFARMVGNCQEELLGRSALAVSPPEDAEFIRGRFDTFLSGQADTTRMEKRYLTKDGRIIWGALIGAAIKDDQGRAVHALSIVEDITERKQTEQALQESEQRFRDLFENAPLCIFEEDFTQSPPRILRVNRRTVETYGWSEEEFASLAVEQVIPAESLPDLARLMQGLEAKGSWSVEGLNRRRDGTIFPVRVSATFSPALGKSRVIVMIEDITERKRAEEALRMREAQYRAVVEDQADLVCRFLPDTTMTFVNEAYCRYFGKKREELVGRSFLPFVSGDHRPQVVAALAALTVASPTATHEEQVFAPSGELRWQQWTNRAVFDSQGHLAEVQATGRDITERKRAEEALLSTRAKLRQLLASSPAIIYSYAPRADYVVAFVSENVRAVLGYDADEVLADPQFWQRHLHPDDRERALAEAKRVFDQGQCALEYRFQHKDGTYRWMRDEERLVRDPAGQPVEVVGCWFDITARRQAEEAVHGLHRQLMTAREQERRDLAGELHDSVGQGLIALQLTLGSALEESRGVSVTLSESFSRLKWQCDALVQEVRRICRGLYPPTLESLGLVAALKELARTFGTGLRVEVQSTPQAEQRFGSDVEIALFRIAQEALSNAIRHGRASRVILDLSCARGRLCLKVADNGRGFEAGSVSDKGLGLRTMEERAQAVGGKVTIASRPGSTRISVRVPAEGIAPADKRP